MIIRRGAVGAVVLLTLALRGPCAQAEEAEPGTRADRMHRHLTVGVLHARAGESRLAVESFRAALEIDPDDLDARLDLCISLLAAGELEELGEEAAILCAADRTSAAGHHLLGCARLRAGDYPGAVQSLSESLSQAPGVTATTFLLGFAHQQLGQAEPAVTHLREVVSTSPEHASAHYVLGRALARLGSRDEATTHLEKHRLILAERPQSVYQSILNLESFEGCEHTRLVEPTMWQRPATTGIQVHFEPATTGSLLLPDGLESPAALIAIDRDGRPDLFARQGDEWRVARATDAGFVLEGEGVFGIPGATPLKCIVADLQNDGLQDVIVVAAEGLLVLKQSDGGLLSDVTLQAGLGKATATDAVLVDLDHTGTLDLALLEAGSGRLRFHRNLGNLRWQEETDSLGLASRGLGDDLAGFSAIAACDLDADETIDLFLARPTGSSRALLNQRHGRLAPSEIPYGDAKAVAVDDLDGDMLPELALTGGAGRIEVECSGLTEDANATQIALLDHDNDGWLDLLAATPRGLRLWRNLGQGPELEVTAAAGLDSTGIVDADCLLVADLDTDGDSDLIVGSPAGLQVLANHGGNTNRQLRIQLMGKRSNASGLGLVVELRGPGYRQSRNIQRLPLEVGLGQLESLHALTVLWTDQTVSSTDLTIRPTDHLVFLEPYVEAGSCPYLYAWDGEGFRFVTDLMGGSPLGLPLFPGRLIDADVDELAWIGTEADFPARDGELLLHVTEELREILYLDQARLVAVDHPVGTEAHSTDKLRPPPFPASAVQILGREHPLRSARGGDGRDLGEALRTIDGQQASPPRMRSSHLRGLAEPHSIDLDFGKLDANRPLLLAMTGWLRYGNASGNISQGYRRDLPRPAPRLLRESAPDEWVEMKALVGMPAGKTKTILVELEPDLEALRASGAPLGRIRLECAMEIHWDRIAMFERQEDGTEHWLDPDVADLHFHGYGQVVADDFDKPVRKSFDLLLETPPWRQTVSGWVTRHGDIRELLAEREGALAMLACGDAVSLSFDASKLPATPKGQVRDYFFLSVGWDKDSDYHVVAGRTVEPIPWHGMDDQRYGSEPRPGDLDDSWMKLWNTRWIGPQVQKAKLVR